MTPSLKCEQSQIARNECPWGSTNGLTIKAPYDKTVVSEPVAHAGSGRPAYPDLSQLASNIRPTGAGLAKQLDGWAVARRSKSLGSLVETRSVVIDARTCRTTAEDDRVATADLNARYEQRSPVVL